MELVITLAVLFLLAVVITVRIAQYRLRRALLAVLAGLFIGGRTKLCPGHPILRLLVPDD